MHIFFSGIGGAAIGPLALIAKQAGYEVSGSDKQDSEYIRYLRSRGITDIHIGQTKANIAGIHSKKPIGWVVYSSAVQKEQLGHPELVFAKEQSIRSTKRDVLINQIIKDKRLKMIAVAGTHGKTTTTAMLVWLFQQLGMPVSYSLGAKISFGDMGQYKEGSEYFVYECDEFDRNFLAFEPHLSLITGVSWDHHEIYPTREDYKLAFREFTEQSGHVILWQDDAAYLGLEKATSHTVLDGTADEEELENIAGFYNRLDAWLAASGIARLTGKTTNEIATHMAGFPGLQRRMEEIVPGLYSDYAHTPEKIRGAMSVALELRSRSDLAQKGSLNRSAKISKKPVKGRTLHKGGGVVVVYEPLTNRRQHYMMDDYKDCFEGADKVYWLPSYLAREDSSQRIIPPEELISHLSNPGIAETQLRDQHLKQKIQKHLDKGDMVVCMAGGGGDSLDEWLRANFNGSG